MIAPCPSCGRVDTQDEIVPDGVYTLSKAILLISFKCLCGTNRAIRYQDADHNLKVRASKVEEK
jgi:hypothetical protein